MNAQSAFSMVPMLYFLLHAEKLEVAKERSVTKDMQQYLCVLETCSQCL